MGEKEIKENGPWKIKESNVVYENPWIKITEDKVIRPDGKDGIFGTIDVVHGVAAIPVDKEGNAYFCDEFNYAQGCNSIQACGGCINDREDALEAAKREMKEELGIEAEEWTKLCLTEPLSGIARSPQHLFLAKNICFVERATEGTETIQVVKMPFQQALKMVEEGKIRHSSTQLILLMAKDLIKDFW